MCCLPVCLENRYVICQDLVKPRFGEGLEEFRRAKTGVSLMCCLPVCAWKTARYAVRT